MLYIITVLAFGSALFLVAATMNTLIVIGGPLRRANRIQPGTALHYQ